MAKVAALWRHPIKSHGREAIESVTLSEGQTMPWDRTWAVTHENSKFDPETRNWVMCRNFMIGASTPSLAGLRATLDEQSGHMTIRHQDLGSITFNPDDQMDADRFIDWVKPICPADKRLPTALVRAKTNGMTDTDYPTVSIMNTASHAAVEGMVGHTFETERWRGNIWLEGLAAWGEFNWVGRRVRIGEAVLFIEEPIQRCNHTKANPITGERDVETLGALRDGWGHQNFGVYASVTKGGAISLGDDAEILT